jgi:hypothetical protein
MIPVIALYCFLSGNITTPWAIFLCLNPLIIFMVVVDIIELRKFQKNLQRPVTVATRAATVANLIAAREKLRK